MCLFIPQCLRLVTHGLSKTGASDQPLANPLEFNANTDITYACACTHGPSHSHPTTEFASFLQHVLVFNLYEQIISKCLSLSHTKENKHFRSLLVNQKKRCNPIISFSTRMMHHMKSMIQSIWQMICIFMSLTLMNANQFMF